MAPTTFNGSPEAVEMIKTRPISLSNKSSLLKTTIRHNLIREIITSQRTTTSNIINKVKTSIMAEEAATPTEEIVVTTEEEVEVKITISSQNSSITVIDTINSTNLRSLTTKTMTDHMVHFTMDHQLHTKESCHIVNQATQANTRILTSAGTLIT